MARDPLLTPGDRLRCLAANWVTLCIVAVTIVLTAGFGWFSTSGTDRIITGQIVRIEQLGLKSLDSRAVVRLEGNRQITIVLPSKTNCFTGSEIQILERENLAGRTYRAALNECSS